MSNEYAPVNPDFVGLRNMENFHLLPFLRHGVKVHYEGSIDKKGGNADWDWWLYQKNEKEWVLLDVEGPGCLYNFAQHRYHFNDEVVFRFYFDGEETPRFELKQSEFGWKPPFVKPLCNMHAGWVRRFFVPMQFARSCRVTSSRQLFAGRAWAGEGGWGHIVYHTYDSADGIETFTGREDCSKLLELWRNVGRDPKPTEGNVCCRGEVRVGPGACAALFEAREAGCISAIRLQVKDFRREHLQWLWVRATWDDHGKPDVLCPLGALFGNELGNHDIHLLSHGMSASGEFYSYFPMPYWTSARVEIENRGDGAAVMAHEIETTPPSVRTYPREECGYFRAIYRPRSFSVPDRDFQLAVVRGRGHLVAAQITGERLAGSAGCEGDVRVHIDGCRTPAVESDGSESWACYGYGFWQAPQSEPGTGYDGNPGWSMVKLCSGDWYPFATELKFGVEHGDCNDNAMEHSGAVLWYGVDTPALALTDVLDIGNEASEKAHDYQIDRPRWAGKVKAYYEGDDDDVLIADTGRSFSGHSEFTLAIRPDNRGVRLRRRSDQAMGRQRAWVFVDEVPVVERRWYFADRNPYKRWLEDEFEIPAQYTRGKSKVRIRLEFAPAGDAAAWTEFKYWAFCHVDNPEAGVSLPDPDALPDWHEINAEAAFDTEPWHVHNEGSIWFSKKRGADTVYAFLTRAFLEEEFRGPDIVLKSVGATAESVVEVLAPSSESKPKLEWSQEPDGLHMRLGSEELWRDDRLLPKPLVVRIARARRAGQQASTAAGRKSGLE